jgi:hypothetical protein
MERNELVVTSNKLTKIFLGLITSGLGSDVARRPPVLSRWSNKYTFVLKTKRNRLFGGVFLKMSCAKITKFSNIYDYIHIGQIQKYRIRS